MALRHLIAVFGPTLLLAACGGGSSQGSPSVAATSAASTSTPVMAPPAVEASVVIFNAPVQQTYASLGASTTSAGNGYDGIDQRARLTDVSLEPINQPQLRYASGGYEIQLPGGAFDRLVHYKGLANPTTDSNFLQPASALQNLATFIVQRSRLDGYLQSELASWTDSASRRSGFVAFGTPTPAAAIPTSGSATYQGRAAGLVDITYRDNLYGGYFFSGGGGTLTLTIDFAAHTVEGTFNLVAADGKFSKAIPLTATAFIPGTDTYRGAFGVLDAGLNELRVQLTGADAGELLGSWALPVTIDGEPHQLMGAWIARH